MVLKIKELLYDRGFTIAGARKQLSRKRAAGRRRKARQVLVSGSQGIA